MQPLSVCVCVCSGVLIFVQFWDSEEGFHLWVAECRASVDAGSLQDKQSFSVTLACKSRLPFCVFLKLLTRFLLYVQVSWGGESSETFCKYFWKSCGRFFLYLENQTRSCRLHCCGCHFFNCFFFFLSPFSLVKNSLFLLRKCSYWVLLPCSVAKPETIGLK